VVLKGRPGAPRVVRQWFWDLVRSGVSPQEAAAGIGMPQVWERWLAAAGGVKGNGPGPVGGRYLSLADREEIALGLARGESCRQIGARLSPPRPASTISREVARNGPRERYRAVRAQALAEQRARRPRQAKLAVSGELRDWVRQHLQMKWSPEQISARLAAEFGDRPEMRVSHETIYQSIYVQGRGAAREDPGHGEHQRAAGRGGGPGGARALGG
jgi:transposase